MAASKSGDGSVIIKKYANRRLYNTETSTYITLEHLADLVREKRDFKVVDAKSGEDITHNVLTQIIMEAEGKGSAMLPVNFLRQLIAMYGGAMQPMVPQYLEASLDSFQRNHNQFRDAMAGAFVANPFAEMTKRNLELFAAAANGGAKKEGAEPEAAAPQPDTRSELAELRAQLAAMQQKLDKLGG